MGRGQKMTEVMIKKRNKTRRDNLNGGWYKDVQERSRIQSERMKGVPKTKEHKENLSRAHKGKKFTKEHKENLSIAHTEKYPSEETREKMRKARNKRLIQPNKGKKFSKEWRENLGKSRRGEKNGNWQDGKSFEPYSVDWTKILRKSIRERDHYICQLCSKYGDVVHHKDYNKKNCNPDNLIILCRSCNSKVNFNREYWEEYFKINKINKINS